MSQPCKKCRSQVYLGIGHTCPDTACYYNVPVAQPSPSRARPSDRAIAQAFWQISERSYAKDGVGLELFAAVERHAREIDARDTTHEARAGDCLTGPLDPEGLIQQFQGDARLMPQTIVGLARELLTTKATP